MKAQISTDQQTQILDITDQIESELPSDVSGVATVYVHHTTAAITINEPETRLLDDIESFLIDLVAEEGWAHDRLDGNADSHLRALLLGPSVSIPISNGSFDLGTWQALLFIECDGPRNRTVSVAISPSL